MPPMGSGMVHAAPARLVPASTGPVSVRTSLPVSRTSVGVCVSVTTGVSLPVEASSVGVGVPVLSPQPIAKPTESMRESHPNLRIA